MGVTIHYKGRAKSPEAIDHLVDTLEEIASTEGWHHRKVRARVRGTFEPTWGISFGYIPSQEEIRKEGVRFFPRMANTERTGYFKIFRTKYADEATRALTQGAWPAFSIDTVQKGVRLTIHPRCESLDFIFDLKTLELADYNSYSHTPGIVFGFNGFSCKTQFAGFETHRTVCKLIKMSSRYIDLLDVHDECGYYDSENIETAKGTFDALENSIRQFGQTLRDSGMDVTSLDEP